MKIFKILAVALVAMLGFTACDKECGHEFIEYDHSKDLVGTWTCLTADYAEALVINADGSAVSYGVEDGEYWEGVKGNIKTVNNKMTMTFEDDDNWLARHSPSTKRMVSLLLSAIVQMTSLRRLWVCGLLQLVLICLLKYLMKMVVPSTQVLSLKVREWL